MEREREEDNELRLTLGSRVVGAVHDGSDGETEGHSELGTGGSGCESAKGVSLVRGCEFRAAIPPIASEIR